jgi:hypothetical protein
MAFTVVPDNRIYYDMVEESQISDFFEFLYLDHLPILDRGYYLNIKDDVYSNNWQGPIHQIPIWHSVPGHVEPRRKTKTISLNDIKPSDQLQILHFTWNTHSFTHYEENTTYLQDVVDAVKHCPNIKIVFTNIWDVWSTTIVLDDKEVNLIKWLCDILKPVQQNVFFMIGNKIVVDLINKYLPNTNAVFNLVYFRNTVNLNNAFVPSTEFRSKHFVCLNNRIKKHRLEVFNVLDPDKSVRSFVENGILLDSEQVNGWEWWTGLNGHYQDSVISISTETCFRKKQSESASYVDFGNFEGRLKDWYNEGFYTEKTVKSFVARQIPFVVGTYHIHEVIKNCGFRLCEDFIDYSFDNIEDDDKRLDAIKTEIKRLQDIDIEVINKYYYSDQCQEILDHNYELCKKYSKFNFNTYILGRSNGTR